MPRNVEYGIQVLAVLIDNEPITKTILAVHGLSKLYFDDEAETLEASINAVTSDSNYKHQGVFVYRIEQQTITGKPIVMQIVIPADQYESN